MERRVTTQVQANLNKWIETKAQLGNQNEMHFRWLSTVHDWEKASDEYKNQYYVMCGIYECLGCQRKYKDMPGYVRRGKGSLSFYEGSGDAAHPGYCSALCGSVMGPYSDPLDGWSEDENKRNDNAEFVVSVKDTILLTRLGKDHYMTCFTTARTRWYMIGHHKLSENTVNFI